MHTLFRFPYSCYARKVQMVLDLLGVPYHVVDVPFGDRAALVELTGGYVQVPVLKTDQGQVIVDSRAICQWLIAQPSAVQLVAEAQAGPIWAYSDWTDTTLEDVLFRLATPAIRRQFPAATDRALFTFIKERKFGKGCVESWQQHRSDLLGQANELLAYTATTLARVPFLFGEQPTLADAALYGQFAMLQTAEPSLLAELDPVFVSWLGRLERRVSR